MNDECTCKLRWALPVLEAGDRGEPLMRRLGQQRASDEQ